MKPRTGFNLVSKFGTIIFSKSTSIDLYEPQRDNTGKLKIDRIQYSGYEILYPVPHIAMATAVYKVLNNRPVMVQKLPYS
jgi:hypothetical protein